MKTKQSQPHKTEAGPARDLRAGVRKIRDAITTTIERIGRQAKPQLALQPCRTRQAKWPAR